MKTLEYSQPDFYHFSQDSIDLAKFVADKFKETTDLSVLDVGCGSGVIGVEFSYLHKGVSKLTLVEGQKDFLPHIEKNTVVLKESTKINILLEDFSKIHFKEKFDLVLCNPPYYLEGTGRKSSSELKEKCHFLSQENFLALTELISSSVSSSGEAYLLGRAELPHIKAMLVRGELVEVQKLSKSSIFSLVRKA